MVQLQLFFEAISVDTLERLYEFNGRVGWTQENTKLPIINGEKQWAGPRQRAMLTLAYALAFTCF